MLKSELRKIYRNKRAGLSKGLIENLSLEISNQLLYLPIWEFNYYHIFLNDIYSSEVDTTPIITILQGKDKNIVVPRVKEHHELEHFLLTDNTRFQKNSWGIPEPVDGISIPTHQIEVVIIPLLVYDDYGNRLGYGKGYYDSFLQQCHPICKKIGVSFFPPAKQSWRVEPHDVRLDFCVTPKKIFDFR